MSAQLQAVAVRVQDCMDAILSMFKPGAKITVLVRTPSHPNGERDFVMTSDELAEAIRALEIRKTATP